MIQGKHSLASKKPSYSFEVYPLEIAKKITFRPVSMELDFERLYSWHHSPHVIPFWNLNISRENYREHLEQFLENKNQTLYIGLMDEQPMSYFEAYWCQHDMIGKFYDALPTDRGLHLLIGPSEYLGKGYAFPLLKAMMQFQFKCNEITRIIAEPDKRNKKMIHIFEKCGFKIDKEVDLPDKTGVLMVCDRKDFFGS